MKKNWYVLGTILMTFTLILSACGTSVADKEAEEVTETPESQVDDTVGNEEEEVVTEEPTGEENPEVDSEEEPEVDLGEEPVKDEPAEDKGAETDSSDNRFYDEATQVKSDTQDFSIHLLPNYKLTGEEPGRDILYSEADESIFMRIETMSPEDVTTDYLIENTVALLEAASDGETPAEISDDASLPTGDDILTSTGYSVTVEDGTVTGLVIEKDDLLVRLTIFDSVEDTHFKDFLHMGESVTKSE